MSSSIANVKLALYRIDNFIKSFLLQFMRHHFDQECMFHIKFEFVLSYNLILCLSSIRTYI